MAEILQAEIIEPEGQGEDALQVKVAYTEATITADFPAMRKALDDMLEPYKGLTPEAVAAMPIKDAKQCRTNLNKMRKDLNDRRIAIGKEYNRPFEEFKAQVDALIASIDEPRELLDAGIKAHEQAQKEQRREKLGALYEEFCPLLVPNVPFERILEPQWLNASFGEKKAEQALCDKAARIAKDWEALNATNLYFPDEAAIKFFNTLSLQDALEYDRAHAEEVRRLEELREEVLPEADPEPAHPMAGIPITEQPPGQYYEDPNLYRFTIEVQKTEFETDINTATALKNFMARLGIPAKMARLVRHQEV